MKKKWFCVLESSWDFGDFDMEKIDKMKKLVFVMSDLKKVAGF